MSLIRMSFIHFRCPVCERGRWLVDCESAPSRDAVALAFSLAFCETPLAFGEREVKHRKSRIFFSHDRPKKGILARDLVIVTNLVPR